jgi:hypothetical protein
MRLSRISLALAGTLFLAPQVTSQARAQDDPAPTQASSSKKATPPDVNLGTLTSPGTQLLEAAKKAGHVTADGRLMLEPGQTLKFRAVAPPFPWVIDFGATPNFTAWTGATTIGESDFTKPQLREYSITLSPMANESSRAGVRLSGWTIVDDTKSGTDAKDWNFDIAMRAVPPTVDLGVLSAPSKDFLEEAKKAGHLATDGSLTLAPGQTLKFRTTSPVELGNDSALVFNAEPSEGVTWTRTPTTVSVAGSDVPGMEYAVTLKPDAPATTPVRILLSDPARTLDVGVKQSDSDDGRAPPPPRVESPSIVGSIVEALIFSPLEALTRAIWGFPRSTGAAADRRESADSKTLVGADGRPVPDDVAKAIRERGSSAATPGLSGVLRERISEESHPERGSGE